MLTTQTRKETRLVGPTARRSSNADCRELLIYRPQPHSAIQVYTSAVCMRLADADYPDVLLTPHPQTFPLESAPPESAPLRRHPIYTPRPSPLPESARPTTDDLPRSPGLCYGIFLVDRRGRCPYAASLCRPEHPCHSKTLLYTLRVVE
jgi:hypothetical protein